jgi:hypothetical protein
VATVHKLGFTHERPGGGSIEWFTPPELFDALGIDFDLDPAAPPGGVPWVPAKAHYSKVDDGLAQPWFGRVWLNPPYGRDVDRWMRKLVAHGDGLALVFTRSDTKWFSRSVAHATALCFIAGRLRFRRGDGAPAGPAAAPSVLLAYGVPCAIALAESGLGQTLLVPHGDRSGAW